MHVSDFFFQVSDCSWDAKKKLRKIMRLIKLRLIWFPDVWISNYSKSAHVFEYILVFVYKKKPFKAQDN